MGKWDWRIDELGMVYREACDYPWTTRDNAHHIHTCAYEDPHPDHDTHDVCLCGAHTEIERVQEG